MTHLSGAVRWLACDLATGDILEELNDLVPGGTLNRILSDVAQSTPFTLPIPQVGNVGAPPPQWESATEAGRTMIVMVLDGLPRWAGVILEREGGTEADVSLACTPLEGYLGRRYVQDHSWVNQDAASVIATGLIGDAQSEGINLVVDAPACGTLLSRTYVRTDDMTVLRALNELVILNDGIEWTIDLAWKTPDEVSVAKIFRVRKRIGQAAPPSGPTAIFSTVSANDARYRYRESYAEGDGANHVIARARGQGDLRPESAPARDDALIALGWPRWEQLVDADSSTGVEEIIDAATLQGLALGRLEELRRGSRTFRITVNAGPPPRLGQQWELGDDVGFDLIGHRHPLGAEAVARVLGWAFDVRAEVVEPQVVLLPNQFVVEPTPPPPVPEPPPEIPATRCQVQLRSSIKTANTGSTSATSLAVDRPDDTEVGDRHYVVLSSNGGAVTHSAPDGTWRQVGSTIIQSNAISSSLWAKDATVAGAGSHGSFSVGGSNRRICLTAFAVFDFDATSDSDGTVPTVLATSATVTFPAATPSVEKDLLVYAGAASTAAGGTGSVSGWEAGVTERVDQVTTHATNAQCNQFVATFPVTGSGQVPAEAVTLAQGSFGHVGFSLLIKSGVSPCGGEAGGGEPVSDIYVPAQGAWHGNSPGARALTAFEGDIGQTVDIVHRYKNFGHYDTAAENFPGATEQAWIDQGRMLFWSWKTVGFTWSQIAAGSADAVIDATAANIVEWENSATGGDWSSPTGKKIKTFFCYHHEPEGDDTFGTSADYVAAWQYIHDRMIQQGVRSLIFVYIAAGYKDRTSEWHAKYPGDAYVDWIGYDPYPRTCSSPIGPNDPFFESFGEDQGNDIDNTGKYRVYKWATGVGSQDPQDGITYVKPGAHNMPIMVGEWSPTDSIANPTGAMVPIFQDWKTAIETGRYPQVKAWVYWESGENPANDCTHRINITSATTTAYKAVTDLAHLNQPRPY